MLYVTWTVAERAVQQACLRQHFAGVKLRVKNKASSAYENNVNNEIIVLSGGETLHADCDPMADCGNFDDGQIKLKGAQPAPGT